MTIKVYYYDFKFWRAEVLRCGLFLQNIPFEDIRDKEALAAVKDRTPMKAFPVLEIDDQILSQTPACATYVGKLGTIFDYAAAGAIADPLYPCLYPPNEDALLQARCDEIVNACGDVTSTIASTFRLPSKEETETKRKALMQADGGRLYMHLNGLDSLLCKTAPGIACGPAVTVADLCIWRLVCWLNGGNLDYIPTDFVSSNFANLQAVYEACEGNEKIGEYVKQYHK